MSDCVGNIKVYIIVNEVRYSWSDNCHQLEVDLLLTISSPEYGFGPILSQMGSPQIDFVYFLWKTISIELSR